MRVFAGWPLLALAAILGVGGWMRFSGLARPSFDIDEYLHVYPAQAWIEQGRPALPSGKLYTRARPYTWVVAQSFRAFGVSEWSARLPSALLDLLAVALAAWIAWRWFGPSAGLLTGAALALSPWWIMAAKNCRMYPLFHLAYLAAAWATWHMLEGSAKTPVKFGVRSSEFGEKGSDGERASVWRVCAWGVAAMGAGLLALFTQRLAGTFAVSVAVFVLGRAVWTRSVRDRWLAVAVIAASAALALVAPGVLGHVWREINRAPDWANASRYDWGFFVRKWWPVYPLAMALYLPALAVAWRRRAALGWYLACLGLVPFALHSIVFDWKMLRYSYYLLPWLIVPVAALLGEALARLWRAGPRWTKAAAAALLFSAAMPWVRQSASVAEAFPSAAWREAYAWLAPQLKDREAVIAALPLATLYYLRRPASYAMNNVHKRLSSAAPDSSGHLDYYSGRPMITTLTELERALAAHPGGWIIADRVRFHSATAMPRGAREYIEANLERVPVPGSEHAGNPVIVYRWNRRDEK